MWSVCPLGSTMTLSTMTCACSTHPCLRTFDFWFPLPCTLLAPSSLLALLALPEHSLLLVASPALSSHPCASCSLSTSSRPGFFSPVGLSCTVSFSPFHLFLSFFRFSTLSFLTFLWCSLLSLHLSQVPFELCLTAFVLTSDFFLLSRFRLRLPIS